MEQQKKGGLWGFVASIFRGIDLATRIILNLVVLTVVFTLLAFLGEDRPRVPDGGALVVAPHGRIVEQLAGDPVDRAIDRLTGEEEPETLWRDLDDAIRAAAGDERIRALYLDLDAMTGAGLSTLQSLRAAIDAFRETGKPVVAAADFYGKNQYYLASAADEIHLHPMGVVWLDGYGRFRTYYKEGLDRFGIDYNVFRVGEYKSAVEPYLYDDMSEDAKRANLDWLGDLWRSYLADVAAARGLNPEAVADAIARYGELLADAEGQDARVALEAGLVDRLGDREELRLRMIELVGEDEETGSFSQIGHEAYLEAMGEEARRHPTDGDAVAVLVARGAIVGGHQPPGTIGSESIAALVRGAREDESVKAIVLRVDSGGGSSFASELIHRELALARAEGKKVVASMGPVAASGGYWIATAADEIWASPNTLTGSIGIYTTIPTFQKPLEKYLGVRVRGVGTTWLSGAVRPDRELEDGVAELFRARARRGYQEFLARVAEARGMTPEEVDEIGRGRVWSGVDARDKGLVDRLGGLEEAIASAAALAGLGEGHAVRYLEPELEWSDSLFIDLLTRAASWLGPGVRRAVRRPALEEAFRDFVRRQSEMLGAIDDPGGIYALCFCEVE